MDSALQEKWNQASRTYDLITWGDELRFGDAKRRAFAGMSGRCLMLASGTGNDFRHFPPGLSIVAIDISPAMVDRARRRASIYRGELEVRVMDAQNLEFDDASFDTVATAMTFCSIPDPLRALREVYRCLKPGGRLLMFEHVRSRLGVVAILQDLMTPLARRLGPEMNRDTVGNVLRAGFAVVRESNVYLDVVKSVEAFRPVRAEI